MPTRKIKDLDEPRHCSHPEHDPPKMMVFPSGVYEHECPACHRKVTFTVRNPTLGTVVQPRSAIQQVAPRPAWAQVQQPRGAYGQVQKT